MAVFVRTVEFTLKPGTEEKALALLREHTQFIAGFPGCVRAYVATPIHGTSHLVHSEWSAEIDIDRLEGALRSDPTASSPFFGLMSMLRVPPHVARFQVLETEGQR